MDYNEANEYSNVTHMTDKNWILFYFRTSLFQNKTSYVLTKSNLNLNTSIPN